MDKVIELAREAGFHTKGAVIRTMHSNGSWVSVNGELERFYTLARADLEAENAKLRSFTQEYIEAWEYGMAGDGLDRRCLAFGNVHLTREAAQEHADAMRKINTQGVGK